MKDKTPDFKYVDQIVLPALPWWFCIKILIIFGKSIKNGIYSELFRARRKFSYTLMRGSQSVITTNFLDDVIKILPDGAEELFPDKLGILLILSHFCQQFPLLLASFNSGKFS